MASIACGACGGSSSSGNGGDVSPDGGPGAPPSGGKINATSTNAERQGLCSLIESKKCEAYQGKAGNCLADHGRAAGCFVRTVRDCVAQLATCESENYDGCMTEGIRACDPNTPDYVQRCFEKNEACHSTQRVKDACTLLAALDDEGRAIGAGCVAGSCSALDKCLNELTP
ncbi:hypothetical protein [Pendulispora albinea]|uniref:Uncharacterized protein n=1 Tax=Pendulispora albinea TaxID=2741071 RepID=A0ABZ2M444_9BACT